MKFTRLRFSTRSAFVLCGLVLLTAACGCERTSLVEQASYDDEDDRRDEPVRRKTERASAARRTDEQVAPATTRQGPLNFSTASTVVEPPLSQPIATPLPAQIIATSEAEGSTPPVSYASRAVPPAAPQYAATPAFDVGLALQQAEEHNRRGAAAAAKGAWYTARAEFGEALNQIAAAFDAREGRPHRGGALVAGFTALAEAEAFAGRTAQMPMNTASMLAGHRTAPFLGPLPPGTSPAALHAAYLRFATEHLAEAVAGCESGSVALHGLGKVHNAAGSAIVDHRAKAQSFYEAALAVGPGNFLAANDLAVLLAEEGRLEQAREILHGALRQSPQPAMWSNLAAVHDRLGRPDLAQLARQEAVTLERRATSAPGSVLPTSNVAWLDPRNFAATSRAAAEMPPSPQQAGAVRPTAAAAPAPQRPATGVAQRPLNRALAY